MYSRLSLVDKLKEKVQDRHTRTSRREREQWCVDLNQGEVKPSRPFQSYPACPWLSMKLEKTGLIKSCWHFHFVLSSLFQVCRNYGLKMGCKKLSNSVKPGRSFFYTSLVKLTKNLQQNYWKTFTCLPQYLAHAIVGSSLEEVEEEEDAASTASDGLPPKEGTYKIIGTMKNPNRAKPDWVHEVIDVSITVL